MSNQSLPNHPLPNQQTPTTRRAVRGARRIAIIAIIVSLSLTAIIGIVTLLVGDFGEVQGKILLTTLLLAGFSITVLCHLAVAGRALQVVGFIGIGVSVLSAVLGLTLVWRPWDSFDDSWGELLKWFAVTSIWAVSLAHANLLLLLAQRKNPVIRGGLFATVGMIGLVALLITLPILSEGEIPGENGEWYWRLVGVVAILDVLGTIVLPVASRFLRDEPIQSTDAAAPASQTLELPPALVASLDERAAAAGVTRDALALSLLAGERAPGE